MAKFSVSTTRKLDVAIDYSMKTPLRFLSPRIRFLALRHFRIAIPISLQTLLQFLVHTTDTLVVGQLGEVELAGITIAGQVFFVFILFLFGISSGASTVFSQYWGNKAIVSMQRTFGFVVSIACLGGLLYWIGVGLFGLRFLSLFSQDPMVHSISKRYLSIVLISYPLQGISTAIISLFKSTERSNKVLPIIFLTIIINIALDIVLVFGLLGLPRMGVAGSAIATVIAISIQVIWLTALLFSKKNPILIRLRICFQWSKALVRQIIKVIAPVVANEIGFAFGHILYFIVIGWYGTETIAAYNIMLSVYDILLVGCFGSGEASTVIVGKLIGSQRYRSLERYLRFLGVFVVIFSGVMVGIGAAVSPMIPQLFAIGDSTKRMVTFMILVSSPFSMIGVMNLHLVTGVFRGGADTTYAMLLELGTLWLIGVPLTFFIGSVFDVSVYIIFVCVGSEEIIRLSLSLRRLHTKKWIKRISHYD